MINLPQVIVKDAFQLAWIEALKILIRNGGEVRNLVVHITNPSILNTHLHGDFHQFCIEKNIKNPKQVAYTIFPYLLYQKIGNAEDLFNAYLRKGGMYERWMKKRDAGDWGTYFHRMVCYPTNNGTKNQLKNIINAIKNRLNKGMVYQSCYTIIIQKPGSETIRPLRGPCLNYLAVQMEKNGPTLGLLAVYRNHYFVERAYGNYWGLCNLINFLAQETGCYIGPLTCVSSRARIESNKRNIISFVENYD